MTPEELEARQRAYEKLNEYADFVVEQANEYMELDKGYEGIEGLTEADMRKLDQSREAWLVYVEAFSEAIKKQVDPKYYPMFKKVLEQHMPRSLKRVFEGYFLQTSDEPVLISSMSEIVKLVEL